MPTVQWIQKSSIRNIEEWQKGQTHMTDQTLCKMTELYLEDELPLVTKH